ncbi:uncharacterized protein LOC124491807 isoform X2 [Dermatophagoides farinae]
MTTDVTPTMAMTTCTNEQSPSSITARFSDPLGSPPTVSSGFSDDYYYGPSSGEFSSSANGDSMSINPPPLSCNDNNYWALISKNDNFQLKLESRENFVCFIGSDFVLRQQKQIQSSSNKKNKDDHQAVLIYASGSFHLKDLDSKFGTFVNELRVRSRSFIRLNIDDEIRFGFGPDIYQLKHLPLNQINCNHSPHIQRVNINKDDENHYRSTTPLTTMKNDNINEFIVLGNEHDNVSVNNDDNKQLKQNSISNPLASPTAFKQSPMNKLFRISIRKNDKKSDPVKRGSKKNAIQASTSTASSASSSSSSKSSSSHNKLSPSSFSLMSSSSSSSSQSSTPVTLTNYTQQPTSSSSSMFMSAMKMVKARFKKKSSSATVSAKDKKESVFICSGNDDITFIRYRHNFEKNHPPIHQQNKIEPCSISAPESPNQSRHHVYHSHTYQNTEFLRKLSDDYPFTSHSGFPFITDEHEYDEVTPDLNLDNDADDDEEVPSCCSDVSEQQWTCESKASTNVDDNNQHFNHNHHTLCPSTPLQLLQPNSPSLKTKHTSVMNTATSVQQDCGLYLENHHHDIIDTDEYNASHSHECFDVENHTSTQAISTLSTIHHLPHLNSEDRLNNNSSLDSNIVHFEYLKNLKNNKFESNTSSDIKMDSCEKSINSSTILFDDEKRTKLHQQESNDESFCQNNVIISPLSSSSSHQQETATMTTIETTTVTFGSTSSLLLYTSPKQSSVTSTTSTINNHIQCSDCNVQHRVDYICQNKLERQKDKIVFSGDDGKCRGSSINFSYSASAVGEKEQVNSANKTLFNFEQWLPLTTTTVETATATASVNETTLKHRNNIEQHLNQLNNKSIHKHSGRQQLVVVPVDSDSGAVTDADTNDLYDIDDIGHLRRGQRRPSSSSSSSTKITSSFDHYHTGNLLASTSSGQSSLGTSTTLANLNNHNESQSSSLEHDVEFDYQQQHGNCTKTPQPQSLPVFMQQPRSRHSIGGMAFVIDFNDNVSHNKTHYSTCNNYNKGQKDNRRPSPLLFNNPNTNVNCMSDVEQQMTNVSPHTGNSNTATNDITITATSVKRLSNVTSVPPTALNKTNIAYVFDVNDMNDKQKPSIELSNDSGHTQYHSSSSMKKSDTYDKKINKLLANDMNNDKDNLVKNDYQKNPNNHCSVTIPLSSTTEINEMSKNIETNSNRIISGVEMIDDDKSRHSDATLQQSTSRRSAQLSESAVYLINRMFEHNNYQHNPHHHRSNSTNSHGCYDLGDDVDFDNHHRPEEYFDGGEHYGHIPHANNVKPSIKTSATKTTKPHLIAKSPNSHSIEYDDDSLSLMNSIKDRSHTLAVQSHRSSLHRHTPKSSVSDSADTMTCMDKQLIDSNINIVDDDGELSDTGTYVIDIDELTGEKLRRKSENVMNSKKTIHKSSTKKKSAQPKHQLADDDDEIRIKSSDGDLGVGSGPIARCNDGEGGNGETNSDEFGYEEDDDDDEDKLEVARKQIDELFSNYEKQKKNSSHQPLKKDATFTRSKRRSSCSEVNSSSTYHNDKSCRPNQMIGVQQSTQLFNVIDDTVVHSKNTGDKSKKRISSELMSAFKRINSKLEKTARLGKLSLLSSSSTSCTPLVGTDNTNTNDDNHHSTKSVSAQSKLPIKCRSAPSTPLLDDRKHSANNRLCSRNINGKSRISSAIPNNEYSSSTERIDNDDRQQRARSGSITSSNSASSSLRFNRAFALRRARLGMDTCGVEISEQSANKAKESQKINSSKTTKLSSPVSFKRNDGGRFSLRVPGARIPFNTCNQSTKGSRKPPSSSTTVVPPTNRKVLKQSPVSSKIPTLKSYSASSSVCSSIENLSNGPVKGKAKDSKSLSSIDHRNQSQRRVIPHSDNEIQFDAECSSCDDGEILTYPALPFTRFGRRSLRFMPSSGCNENSTPWLKSLSNKSVDSNADIVNKRNKAEIQPQPINQGSYSLFGGSRRTSSANSYCSESESQNYSSAIEPSSPSIVDPRTARPIVPPFQVGKRFFSTKPHRMAQFDKDFNTIIHGHHSASANPSPMRQLSADPNLMTHSVTECLLSDRSSIDGKRQEIKSNEISAASTAIASSINARIFSISPLDSLVISAINQLSSKLRTRMRDFLERERYNHLLGSEARTLIDEILPQVNTNGNGPDSSKSNQIRNNYNHDSSNISRDLSNILKNLKKVEQIFDVFSMVVEPYTNESKIVELHKTDGPIITNASDTDTSGSDDGTNGSVVIANCTSTETSINRSRRSPFIIPTQQSSAKAFSQSPPSSESLSQSRSGFFIEI